jgi:hypothetical protein
MRPPMVPVPTLPAHQPDFLRPSLVGSIYQLSLDFTLTCALIATLMQQ